MNHPSVHVSWTNTSLPSRFNSVCLSVCYLGSGEMHVSVQDAVDHLFLAHAADVWVTCESLDCDIGLIYVYGERHYGLGRR